MASSVYVAGVEGFTGKSAVALGLLEILSRRVQHVSVFRPVVRTEASAGGTHDNVLDLLV
jgi:phosphate acetyltransferase